MTPAACPAVGPRTVAAASGGEEEAGGVSGLDSGFDFDDDDTMDGNVVDGMALWGVQAAPHAGTHHSAPVTNGADDAADVDADDSGLDFDDDDDDGGPDSRINAGMALWGAQ